MRDEEAKAARPAAADAKARNKDALSGLAARVARLEARAWRGKQAEEAHAALAVPALVEASSAQSAKLASEHQALALKLEQMVESFAHRTRVALQARQQQRANELQAFRSAAADGAKEAKPSKRPTAKRPRLPGWVLPGRLGCRLPSRLKLTR